MHLKQLLLAAGMASGMASGMAAVAVPALAADVAPWPAPAPAPVPPDRAAMGYAELAFGWYSPGYDLFLDDDDGDEDFNIISGAGVANIPFGGMWNFELEAQGYSIYQSGEGTLTSEVGGYGHVYWRDPSRWALGGFGGYTNFTVLGGQAVDKVVVGAEGLVFWNALTLLAQGGYVNLSAGEGGGDGFLARGALRYFVTPNFRLQGDVQWTSLDLGDWQADDLAFIGTAEYRLPNIPLSGFASYRWDNGDTGDADYDSSTIKIGIRGYLGSGNLLDNDRNGAPFDVLPFEIGYPRTG